MDRPFYNTLRSIFLVLLTPVMLQAQIQVTNTLTPVQLVENVLVGSGVTATNITVNGSAANAGTVQASATYFNQNGTTFPIYDGVLLTTGRGTVAIGPNNQAGADDNSGTLSVNDADMDAIAAADVENGIVVEFDFVATGNQLEFKYIFGSEEYPEFAPPNSSAFNDVFGFFLSGPGISGPYANGAVNIATIPGTTTPVSINNVNAITNNTYYVNNAAGLAYGTAIQYDGTTITMTAFSELICGETYHIKLGIANVGDEGWDSGVFLEAGSFTTNPVQFSFSTFTNDNTIYEGCNQTGELIFTRAGCGNENDTLVAYITYGGTAINGVDYNLLEDSVVLIPGVDTVVWIIDPIEDGLAEGIETIEIEVMTIVTITGDTLYGTGIFYINDQPELILQAHDATYYCLQHDTQITSTVTGGIAPYEYLWDHGDTTATTHVDINENGVTTYILTVTDACGYTATDTAYLTMNQTLAIDTILSTPATCLPIGTVSIQSFPYGAHLQNPGNPTSYNLTFDWTYENDTLITFPNQSALEDLPGGWYYIELTDNVINCTVSDSVFVDVVDVPIAVLNADPGAGCAPLGVTFTNQSQNSNQYFWNFGDGTTTTTSDLSSVSHTFNQTSIVQLVASNGDVTCNDTVEVVVDIVVCGCTDPTAVNYNIAAVIDDGSCIYPTPTVDAPNVITINGDNVNDFYFLKTEYAASIELTIVDRWGMVVFEGMGSQSSPPIWDGKDKSGNTVTEGVYFYKYIVTGQLGDVLEGHGFITVVH